MSVLSHGADESFDPQCWEQLFATSHYQYRFDRDKTVQLDPEWMDNPMVTTIKSNATTG